MPEKAWFLRCGPDDVGDSAVVVGDRGRVATAADLLDDPAVLNTDRGLTTVTGGYAGRRVTVAAFGMGAPAAAVVLEELAGLGVRRFLRLGTALALGETRLGQLVLAEGAVRGESTSAGYVPPGFPALPDHDLCVALRERLAASSRPWRSCLFASHDGFYTDMFAARPDRAGRVAAGVGTLTGYGVGAMDMETSAVLVVARALGAAAASLCLASVDAADQRRMDGTDRAAAEQELMRTGLDALTTS